MRLITILKNLPSLILILLLTISVNMKAQDFSASLLKQEFQLTGQKSSETQYYSMETRVVSYAPDGKRSGAVTYRLKLKCVPGKDGEEYTSKEFTLQKDDTPPVTIPALAGWTYLFKRTESGLDEKGQVLGIDHSKFENLSDSTGKVLPPDKAYAVYNSFIDFHSFCNVLAEKTTEGKGIQDLKKIGQKIIHAAAFSEPPVNLGRNIKQGSTFKNGEVTLEFKGLGVVDDRDCALLGFDSGESSFKMIMQPTPEMEIIAVGGSHYQGDIYIDLESKWVRRVSMTEMVVIEVQLPMPPSKVNSVVERISTIHAVSKKEFDHSF
jgi:hypothetical protein